VGHALGDQAINEKVAGKLLSHAGIVPRSHPTFRSQSLGRRYIAVCTAGLQGLSV
jgi:hypothetical protein